MAPAEMIQEEVTAHAALRMAVPWKLLPALPEGQKAQATPEEEVVTLVVSGERGR